MDETLVDVDNFARAETDRMFTAILRDSGGVNAWMHNRTPTPLDHQPVIRQNRDTLYSAVLADVSAGATVTLPHAGGRYLSAMPIDQDGYVDDVFHGAGEHRLDPSRFGTRHVLVAVRTLVDPGDPADVAAVNALQDRMRLDAGSAAPFAPPAYDEASFTATRDALQQLGRGLRSFERAFGARGEVDPVRHLIGTAGAWGGLPEREATYLNVEPRLPASGAYRLTVRDVPVDGFWSISLYGADGYFPRDHGSSVSVNNVTAARDDDDASVTVHFGGDPGLPNRLPLVDGWNYVVRLYRPRAEILDGSWTFPQVSAA
ncbi:DUF1254 domain-containing protein [Jiangella endophytica]|uniref:DUF1254 domain-containing protein n=1 Tax=Jiangella endophytica TaxID=1623398 RepID=UPI000E348A88|nr:DUF1254 domain-containing protein [Jiangella endophytica]